MEQQFKSFLRNYYISSTLYDFVFAYAIYTVFFSLNGLSVFQISLLLSWWAFTSVVLEVPSGALADHWSRRKMLIIAPVIKSLCFVIWFFAYGNIYLYGLGFLFWSIGSTFVSGTTEALLYDYLAHNNKKEEYEKILGRKKFYFYLGLAGADITGGIIAYYSIGWTLIFSVIPLLLSAFFASLLREAPKEQSTEEIHYFDHIRQSYKEIKGSKTLFYLAVFAFAISIFEDLEELDQLYYKLVNIPLLYFGILGAIYAVLRALGSKYAFKLKGKKWVFYVFSFFAAVLLLLVGFYPGIPMVVLLLVSYLFATPLITLNAAKIQHCIASDKSRATVTSAVSLLIGLLGIVIIIGFGIISKIWNLQAVYISTGVFLMLLSLWSFAKRKILG